MWSAQGQNDLLRVKGRGMSNSFKSKWYRLPVAKPIPQTRPKRAYSLPLAWSRRRASAAGGRGDLPGSWTEHGFVKI